MFAQARESLIRWCIARELRDRVVAPKGAGGSHVWVVGMMHLRHTRGYNTTKSARTARKQVCPRVGGPDVTPKASLTSMAIVALPELAQRRALTRDRKTSRMYVCGVVREVKGQMLRLTRRRDARRADEGVRRLESMVTAIAGSGRWQQAPQASVRRWRQRPCGQDGFSR